MSADGDLRTALIVAVHAAASTVDDWRERTCQAKPSTGVPAHITVLWPFVPAGRVDAILLDRLTRLFETLAPFGFELRTTARFPGTLYLAPEPADPFVNLAGAVYAAYPCYPPYEGVFDSIVPHLTTAQGDDALLDEAESDVLQRLPIVARAQEVLLIEEVVPDSSLWRPRATFALGA